MLVLAWTARSSLLTAAANICIVDDAFQEANAIVVLVGGLDTRPFAAAELFRRGLAPRILVSDTKTSPAERLGILPREVDPARTSLAKLGVPAGAVAVLGEEVSNTYEEARALGAWARSAGAKRVIVPTEIFVTHRTRWIMAQQLAPSGAKVSVHAIMPREYAGSSWWQHEQGIISFQNEILKYLYYRLRYWSH